jgi:hypothetical protein
MLAVGAVGLGSAYATTGAAEAGRGAASAPPTSPATTAGGALALDGVPPLGGLPGLAPGAPAATHAARVAISARAQRRDLLVGWRISVDGALSADTRRHVVALQERRGRGWLTMAWAATGRSGRYSLGFRPATPGRLSLRVRFAGDRTSAPALAGLGAIDVYRLAGASWYGPGGPLACGGTLTEARLGVAHKTLPCGTMVSLRHGSRTVRVPVIDRGPYVAGRDYDLTPATKRALGFGDTGEVWATS